MKFVLIFLVMAIGCMIVAGCSDEKDTAVPSGDLIDQLVAKSQAISCVSYQVEVSIVGAPFGANTSIWVKDNVVRAESAVQGNNSTILMDMENALKYTLIDGEFEADALSPKAGSALNKVNEMSLSSPEIVDTETVDGKQCIVVAYITSSGADTKMWLWEEHGFPVKMETTEPKGTTLSEYSSIDFVCADDDLFDLP